MSMAKDKNPKVAGQILDVGGERIAIIRGPLADALDINNWNIVSDTTTKGVVTLTGLQLPA